MARANGRFSVKDDFKKYPYCNHSYARLCIHRNSLSGNHQSIKRKLTDQSPANSITQDFISDPLKCSIKIRGVTEHSPDKSITQFPSQDDISKCCLLKVFQFLEPQVKNILYYITSDKMDFHTLETYALKKGKKCEWLKIHFSDDQIYIIRQNPNFENFDLILKFKCIEVFKDFDQKIIENKGLSLKIGTTIKKLKLIRNNICHNREQFTQLKCHEEAESIKVYFGELLEILYTWNESLDISTIKKDAAATIDKIMNGVITEGDFKYICLQEVMNLVVEPSLNIITQIICHEKKDENFKQYLVRNGMKSKKYKNYFFKEEKNILESNSKEIKLDITLHTKIIELCKEWHPVLKDDIPAKEELTSIVREIRGVRNTVSHSILSMTPKECTMEANHFRKGLEDLDNFLQRKKIIREDVDAPVIDINEINSNIESIMTVPYCTLPSQ